MRRQQKEEEKRKATEAVGNNIQITNDELMKEADLTDREDTELELRNTNDFSTNGNSSNSEDSAVNGSFSPTDVKEDQKFSTCRSEDDEISRSSSNGRDHPLLYENLQKVHFTIYRGWKFKGILVMI